MPSLSNSERNKLELEESLHISSNGCKSYSNKGWKRADSQGNVSAHTSNVDKVLMFSSCLLQIFTVAGFGYGLNVIYAELVQVFQNPRSEVALIQSLFLGLSDIGGIFWSYPVKKYRPGVCVIVATIFGCLGILAGSFSFNLTWIILLVGVVAGGAFGINTVSPYIMTNATFGKRKPMLLSILTCASSLGQFLFTLLIETLVQEYKWNGCFFIMSAVMLNNVLCGLIMHLFDPNRDKRNENIINSAETLFRRDIFNNWKMWLLIAQGFILPVAAAAESRFYVDLLVLKGYTQETGALLASYIAIANLVGRILGVCTKACGYLNSLEHAVYSTFINAFSHLMVIYLSSYWGLFSAAILNGLSLGLLVAHLPVLALDVFGKEKYASAFVALSFINGFGFFVGGFSGGLIQDLLGTYDLLFHLAFAGNIVASVIFLVLALSMRKLTRVGYERL